MAPWRSYLSGGRLGIALAAECLILACWLAMPSADVYAQRSAWNWYFGSNAGITFANGTVEPLTDGRIDTDEGCAVQSHPVTGKLLFYTDGHEVRNSFHQIMPNGNGLQGERSTSQSALILPWPGSDDLYAIFNPAPITAVDPGDRCMCLTYSMVDMRRDVGFGDVIVKNSFVTDDITEHVTATRDCDGTGWWIVVRRRAISVFNAYHLTASGLSLTPVVSNGIPDAEIRDAGQMHASPNGEFIIITSPSGTAQLYRFTRSTGTLFNGIDLFGSDRSLSHYGAAFSADSRYLYIASTVQTPTEGVYITRFDLKTYDHDIIIASRQNIGFLKGSSAFTPMQLAPDKAIYIGRPNEKHLASIPDPSAPLPTIVDTAVTLTGTCRSGLPLFLAWNFTSHVPGDQACKMPVAFTRNVRVCVNECIQLVDESQGLINSWSWNIPTGTPSSPRLPNPVVCFNTPGLHRASLTVSNMYGDDTIEIEIDVLPEPKLSVPTSLSTCPNVPIQLHASGAASYRWSPSHGLSDPNIADPIATIASTSTYTVVGTSADGCKDTAVVTVAVSKLTGGPDATICPGGSATLHASGADMYHWSPENLVDNPSSASPVAKPTQTTEFVVTMTKGSCVVTDTVVVYVEPTFTIIIDGPAEACTGQQITVRATGGGSSFTWSGVGVMPSTTNETVVTITGPTVVKVFAESGGCSSTDSLVISAMQGPVVQASTDTSICEGSTALLRASGSAQRYEWYTTDGQQVDTAATLTVAPLVSTTYVLVGHGAGTCTSSDTVHVNILPAPDVKAGPVKRICLGSATRLSATGVADSYVWSPSTGLDDSTALAPIANPRETTTYTLIATRDGCVTVDSTTVFVSTLDLIVPQDATVCAGSSTDLVIGGAMWYRWSPPDGLSDPTIPNPIVTPKVSTTYEVVGRDAFGCEDKAYVRVTVIDTTSLSLRAATVTAQAGTDNLEIPIIVNADPALLPLFADSLRADLVIPKDVLIPRGFDRGKISISTRGDDRVIRMVQANVQVVNPQQQINALFGTVLVGSTTDAPLRFEKIQWVGVTCPTSASTTGRLFITGCYIKGRSLRFFTPTTVNTMVRPSADVIDVTVEGDEPGEYVVQLLSSNGQVVSQSTLHRNESAPGALQQSIDMAGVAGGMYYVVVSAPSGPNISRVVWLP